MQLTRKPKLRQQFWKYKKTKKKDGLRDDKKFSQNINKEIRNIRLTI